MLLLFYFAVLIQLILGVFLAWAIYQISQRITPLDLVKFRAQTVDFLGNLLADILNHPRVQDALARTVTNGMNHTMEQPDLGMRIHRVNEAMREDNLRMSRAIGEQLPGLAKSFVGGAMSSIITKKNRSDKVEESSLSLPSKQKQLLQASSLTLDSSTVSDGSMEAKKSK